MRAGAVLACLLLGLSACAPVIRGGGPATAAARLEADAIVTADQRRLPLRRWLPAGPPKAVVVALHGFNDYSRSWEGAGAALARRGIAVYAYDQQGFGRAPEAGYWAGTDTLVQDADTALRLVGARHPATPLFLMGESMGGAVAIAALTRPGAPPLNGVVLSAPAVWSRDEMGLLPRSALWLSVHLVPWMTVTGQGLDILPSDNIEMLKEMSRDPLVIKETRIDAIDGLCDLMDEAALSIGRLDRPLLLLYGAHDQIIPPEAMRAALARLPPKGDGRRIAVYEAGYHMLLRDLDAALVEADIAAWIERPDLALPSGAGKRPLPGADLKE